MRRSHAVDLVVNTYRGDLPFLELTLPHIVRELRNAPLRRRILVVDTSIPVGRFAGDDLASSTARIEAMAHRLHDDGVVDEVQVLDWSAPTVGAMMQTWYGDPNAPTSCRAGTAGYQYCAAIDASDAEYMLHLDSDMLLHSPDGGERWVNEAVDALQECPDAISVQPMGGPPMATNLAQLIFGRRARPERAAEGWEAGGSITSRVCLIDRTRLHAQFLPLCPDDPGDRWEQAMTATARQRDMNRYTLVDERSWVLHPLTHGPRYVQALPDLIWAAEHGAYPFRRSGYRWDVRVDSYHVIPWIVVSRTARLAEKLAVSSAGGRPRFGGAGA